MIVAEKLSVLETPPVTWCRSKSSRVHAPELRLYRPTSNSGSVDPDGRGKFNRAKIHPSMLGRGTDPLGGKSTGADADVTLDVHSGKPDVRSSQVDPPLA